MKHSPAPWLRFYAEIPHHLDYPDCTMYQLAAQAAQAYPARPAYEFMGAVTDFKTFHRKILETASAFAAMGIGKGDRVTLALPNIPQALWCFYGLNRLGAVPNMVHPLSAPAEIAFYLRASHSRAIVAVDSFYARVHEAMAELDTPAVCIVVHIADELRFPKNIAYRLSVRKKMPEIPYGERVIDWRSFFSSADVSKLAPDTGRGADVGAILYSGGTTGTTKGILLSNNNFNATALQTKAASGFAFEPGMKMLSVMPVFHGFGLGIGIHTALVFGVECILVPQFSVKTYAKLLRTRKPDVIPGVPTLFEALLRAPGLEKTDLSFLKGVFSGGDSLSAELKRKVDAFLKDHGAKVQIREGYGTTECVTASCLTPRDSHREGSIGIPFPDTYYAICEPGGIRHLEPGQEGEICLRGPSVMLGYMDNPEETAAVLCRHDDGEVWLHTGDLGCMDADGFIYFRQRIKRMIVSSGYNIYPSQLENILDAHEKVLLSCVIGVDDPYKMKKVKAFVVVKPGVVPTPQLREELFAWCRKRIAKYAMPYDIEFRAELPKTLVGKVAYRVLEEEEAGKK
jgi:long-chain acyl-CoA synthetase